MKINKVQATKPQRPQSASKIGVAMKETSKLIKHIIINVITDKDSGKSFIIVLSCGNRTTWSKIKI